MKFFKKKKISYDSFKENGAEDTNQTIDKNDVKKPLVKKFGKGGRLLMAGLLAVSAIFGGGKLIKGFISTQVPATNTAAVTVIKPNTTAPSVAITVPNISSRSLEEILAQVNGFEEFDYEFLTASYVNDYPTIHLNGNAIINGEELNKVLSYTISEDFYNDVSKLEILVTKDSTGSYDFNNDYIKYTEEQISEIQQQLLSISESKPVNIKDMTNEQKIDYIINSIQKQGHNFILTNLVPKGRRGNQVNYTLDNYIYLNEKDEYGNYKFCITSYDLSQYIVYDGIGEDPAIVNGNFVFNHEINTSVETQPRTEKYMSAEEILDAYSLMGYERIGYPVLKRNAVVQVPSKYSHFINYDAIREEGLEK